MFTEVHPFQQGSSIDTAHAALYETPRPLRRYSSGVLAQIQNVLGKMIEKEPARRYSSIEELLVDLRSAVSNQQNLGGRVGQEVSKWVWPLVGAFLLSLGLAWLLGVFDRSVPGEDAEIPQPGLTRVAVLPFENMSPDPGNDYFTDGITHGTSYQLSKIDRLEVISWTFVMSLKNSNKSIREIGEELKVQAVLEGSVRRGGGRVRIIAELIDVETEEHLWEQSYEREVKDIFAIQSGVAKQIASALETELSAEEIARIEKDPTGNLDAYHSYLKGLYFLDKRTEEGLRIAMTHFEAARSNKTRTTLSPMPDWRTAMPFWRPTERLLPRT